AATGIRLPDFNKRVRNRTPIFIEHVAVHDDPLPQRFAFVLLGKIGVTFLNGIVAVDGPCQLRQRVRHDDQRLGWRPLYRAAIPGSEVFRKSTQALFWKNEDRKSTRLNSS